MKRALCRVQRTLGLLLPSASPAAPPASQLTSAATVAAATAPGATPLPSSAPLPLVGVIDMENAEGTIYTPATAAEQLEAHELAGAAELVYTGAASIEEVDPQLRARFAAVMLRRCAFGAPQLALLPNVRHVVRMGAGYDNLDLRACAAAGVVASNCPDAWVEEVADSAMALLLSLLRRTSHLAALVASGGRGGGGGGVWTRQAALGKLGMRRLRGLRLGIVGLGRIGTAVAQRARPFGLDVAFYDPHLPAGAEKGHGGLRRCGSFEELLGSVDALSFHCPLTPETRGMLGADALAGLRAQQQQQRRQQQQQWAVTAGGSVSGGGSNGGGSGGGGLYVVNAARGGVLDEAAALAALADGTLAGMALDSLETEPAVPPALREALEATAAGGDRGGGGLNLLVTPHASFFSDEAFLEMRALAAKEVRRVLLGEAPWYRVTE
jgi:D-3-phosphoglycerate dehydrogenase